MAKIRPTSPRGSIPRPMSGLSPGDADGAERREQLPDHGDDEQDARRRRSTSARPKAAMSTSTPICRKNTGMRMWPIGVSSRRTRSPCSALLRARPARKAPMIGASLAMSASSAKARVKASASATSVPAERDTRSMAPNSAGATRRPTMPPSDEEQHRHRDDLGDREGRHRAVGHEADHHREDDEAHHVVGDRRAEHDARLVGGERPEVAEHPGGDADARGGERGADEQGGVEVLAHQPTSRRGRGPSARSRRRSRPGATCGRPCRAPGGPSRGRRRAGAGSPRSRRGCGGPRRPGRWR